MKVALNYAHLSGKTEVSNRYLLKKLAHCLVLSECKGIENEKFFLGLYRKRILSIILPDKKWAAFAREVKGNDTEGPGSE